MLYEQVEEREKLSDGNRTCQYCGRVEKATGI